MRIDLFAHFTTQEFRQAYLSIPLGAKGRRLDPIAIRTFVQAEWTTDIDVLWDMEQRLKVSDHVVFATDYPYGRNKGEYFLESRQRFVDEAKIDDEARQKIYADNAKKLLHLA